jgi:glycosyltransferase involved in cell wall biosynthesis
MMSKISLVSIIVIFYNEERFIQEAIESVIAQTYPHWELLLVDDGSSDDSNEIALSFVNQRPDQIYYLQHPCGENFGKVASRNLGIQHAKGQYIAFLDADDVWLPHKLAEQVEILDMHPDICMLYGETEYWFSWQNKYDLKNHDFVPLLRIPTDELFEPPKLLPLYLLGKTVVPCPSDIILRLDAVKKIDGFDNCFVGPFNIYEDQAFYFKMCLEFSVMASSSRWFRYRQHPWSSMTVANKAGQLIVSRQFFLNWARDYLLKKNVTDVEVWQALQREIWKIHYPTWLLHYDNLQHISRWIKKWLLRVEEKTIPSVIRRHLWIPREFRN